MPKKIEDMSESEFLAHIETYTPVVGAMSETFWNEPDIVQAAVNLAHNTKLSVDSIMTTGQLPKRGYMNQDELQSLLAEIDAESYLTETITVDEYTATFREIKSGEYEALQKNFFGDIALSSKKDNLERQLNERRVSFPEFATRKNILALVSWTRKGKEMPKDIAVWRALPMRVTAQFEKVIERLNPEDSDTFQDENRGSSPE